MYFNHGDFQPDGWDELDDLCEDAEEGVDLELIVLVEQDRPQEFIVDDFSFDAFIPPGDNYKDQLEQEEREELGKMVQERMP